MEYSLPKTISDTCIKEKEFSGQGESFKYSECSDGFIKIDIEDKLNCLHLQRLNFRFHVHRNLNFSKQNVWNSLPDRNKRKLSKLLNLVSLILSFIL